MSSYSSPFAPIDRDSARLADELRTIAQDDTRRAPHEGGRQTLRHPRLRLRLRPVGILRTRRTH